MRRTGIKMPILDQAVRTKKATVGLEADGAQDREPTLEEDHTIADVRILVFENLTYLGDWKMMQNYVRRV